MTQQEHFDVAAYALGVLDEHDAARFEDHLVECTACAVELESFLEVADILADVDAVALVTTEESGKDGLLLKKMIGEVRRDRRRAHSRRLYSLAAAVIVFAMLAIGALFAGGRWFGPDQQGPPTAQRSSGPTQLDPLPLDEGVGIGGTELEGEQVANTDARSGVRLNAAMAPKDWGTQVQFAISNIKGPLTCRLVAVRTDGGSEVLSTWTVADEGWGTAAREEVLVLAAVTALPRADIAYLQVQSVDANGATKTLVTAP